MIPKHVYFIGAGGIGMANLVRYCLQTGSEVAGYDRTPSQLTDSLCQEGADIVFDDDPNLIPADFAGDPDTLVVYTPAVPDDNRILRYFRDKLRRHLRGRVSRKDHHIVDDSKHTAGH